MGSPPKMDGDGGYGRPRVRGALPFLGGKPDKTIVIMYRIAEADPGLTHTIAQKVTAALRDVRIGEYNITAVLVNEDVKMSVTDTKKLAAQLLPAVLEALQIPQYDHR